MRIVSLCPSLTELVFALERGDELVGVTEWCVHPRPAVDAIEKLGGTKNPKVARIAELAPDVVLMNNEENRREDAEALARAGVRVLSTFPRDVQDTAEMVREIGAALERRREAERIARDIEQRSRRVRDTARGLSEVRWAYLIWRKPYMSVNRDTFVDAMFRLAGGVNVFGAHEARYPEIQVAELTAADPQRVFLCTEPFPFESEHADELARASGLPRERFVIADGELLSWHGSRTPAGIDYAESLIREARG
ncbi:MAG: ABC transporter substrate-binding protein [Planctomycetes bacterium]|nr:ABC transporter substrate-binding protein [Planctomycetota bacterium]